MSLNVRWQSDCNTISDPVIRVYSSILDLRFSMHCYSVHFATVLQCFTLVHTGLRSSVESDN